jgi:hypothetical protein
LARSSLCCAAITSPGGGGALSGELLHRLELALSLVAMHLRRGQFAGESIPLFLRATLLGCLVVCLRPSQ